MSEGFISNGTQSGQDDLGCWGMEEKMVFLVLPFLSIFLEYFIITIHI